MTDDYKKLLADLGITEKYIGVGHCAIRFIDGDLPEAAPRKSGRVFYAE